MEIKDLIAKKKNVDIELEVVELGIVREFSKFGQAGRVVTAIAKDKTGKVNLTLWNEQTDQIKAGDKVKLTNGYVNEWQGELQLTTGRMGTLEIVKAAKDTKKKK